MARLDPRSRRVDASPLQKTLSPQVAATPCIARLVRRIGLRASSRTVVPSNTAPPGTSNRLPAFGSGTSAGAIWENRTGWSALATQNKVAGASPSYCLDAFVAAPPHPALMNARAAAMTSRASPQVTCASDPRCLAVATDNFTTPREAGSPSRSALHGLRLWGHVWARIALAGLLWSTSRSPQLGGVAGGFCGSSSTQRHRAAIAVWMLRLTSRVGFGVSALTRACALPNASPAGWSSTGSRTTPDTSVDSRAAPAGNSTVVWVSQSHSCDLLTPSAARMAELLTEMPLPSSKLRALAST